MELYHNLLYGRPYSTVIELRWRGVQRPRVVQVRRKFHTKGGNKTLVWGPPHEYMPRGKYDCGTGSLFMNTVCRSAAW
eukprot:365381-Chlamydomonas_euryale.AAC.6